MDFQSIRNMVDTLIQTYTCPHCSSQVSENDVDIMGTAGNSLNIEVMCPSCQKHSIVKAQVFAMDIPAEEINEEKLAELQEKLSQVESYKKNIQDIHGLISKAKTNKNSIKDEHIIALNKSLKSKDFNISDLFPEEK